jgi:hypothetical protein
MLEIGIGGQARAVREDFRLGYTDGEGDAQVFEGRIVARSDGAGFIRLMKALSGDGTQLGDELSKLLAKMMDDKDGTVKAKWRLTEMDPPKDLDEDELDEFLANPQYRGPDGQIYPLADRETLSRWDDQALWTTRRRWIELMEHDEDALVEMQDLMKLAEDIMGLTAERPTQRRG